MKTALCSKTFRAFFLVIILCGVCGSIQPAAAVWIIETVASSGDQGSYASIAIDGNDIAHASWYDVNNSRLMYAVRNFDGWESTVIDSGNVGQYSHIAINPTTDQPAIAYFDAGNQDPKYAYYDGDSWHLETIYHEDGTLNGDFIDLAFRGDGVPFVSYHYDNGAFRTMGANVAWRTGSGSWSDTTIDYTTSWAGLLQFGQHTAIAFDSEQYAQVAYRDDILGYQKFGWQSVSGWSFENTVSLITAGEYADLVLDGGDNVFISSYHYDLLYDECVCIIDKIAGGWGIEDVECGSGDFGQYTSLAIDSNDRLHLTYCGENDLRYATETAKGWNIQTIDDSQLTGKFTSLALDSNDQPNIVYYDSYLKDLKYAFNLPMPVVGGIDPNNGLNTGMLEDASITGQYFAPNSTVALYRPDAEIEIGGENVAVTDANHLTCDFDLTDVPVGVYALRVTNQAGVGTLEGAFTVGTLGPEIDNIIPTTGANDDHSIVINIAGDYFLEPLTVLLQKSGEGSVEADSVTVASSVTASATFDLTNMATGLWDVAVATDYGNATLPAAFEVTCGTPVANFSGEPRDGEAPLPVQFTDTSTDFTDCEITAWAWDFGDENTSDEQNPLHVYETAGTYSVTLTVTNAAGEDMEIKGSFVVVSEGADDDTTPVDDDTTPTDDDTTPTDDDTTPTDDDMTDDDTEDDDTTPDDDFAPPDDDDTSRTDDDDKGDGNSCGC